jgi:ariadne-1
MEMDNEDYKVASKGKLKSYEVEYESLSQTAVERLMQRDVDHIRGILFVNVRVLPPVVHTTDQSFSDEHG